MRLLQSTWAELLTLTTAFRSLEQFNGPSTDGGSNINSIGVVGEECSDNGLRLRYATDYWLDERLARECSATNGASSNGTTTITSTPSSTGVITTPTVLDIYNLVSIIDRTSLEISL